MVIFPSPVTPTVRNDKNFKGEMLEWITIPMLYSPFVTLHILFGQGP